MPTINLSTGKKSVEIVRDGEVAGKIYFSPGDPALLSRIQEVQKKVNDYEIDITADMDMDTAMAKARAVDQQFRDWIDYIFDYECSDVIVGKSFSFSTNEGESLIEQFLTQILPYIEDEIKAEADKTEKRRDKYLGKYKKK